MTDRERDVLRVVNGTGMALMPSHVARFLNIAFDGGGPVETPCGWCPVGPPRGRERCASVPRPSAARVSRVLKSLLRRGLVDPIPYRRGRVGYVAKGAA